MATTQVAGDTDPGALPRASRVSIRASTVWIAIGVLLPAVASLAARMSTIDLAYQLRLGRLIWAERSIPSTDAFTFTAAGHVWTDQQWLAQALLWPVFRLGGWPALSLVRAGLIGATFTLVFLACRAAGAGRRASALLALGSFCGAMLGLALRPQLFAFVLFAATAWALSSRRSHPYRVWLVPALVMAWANLHGSFFLGPLLVALALVDARDAEDRRRLLVVGAACVVATLVNPLGPGVYGYVVAIATNPAISRGVTEWAPPTIGDAAGIAFFGSVAALFAWLALTGRRLSWQTLLTLGIFFALGLQSARGTFWWDLAVPVVAARELGRALPRPEARVSAWMAAAVAVAVAFVAVAFAPFGRSTPELLSSAPVGLTGRLQEIAGPGQRVFAPQTWGSWFELELPRSRMFVDSRIELFSDRVWNDYFSVTQVRAGWQRILDRWHVDVVVADPSMQPDLVRAIGADPGWTLAYRDANGSVFVRR